jgi:hypothetical protein
MSLRKISTMKETRFEIETGDNSDIHERRIVTVPGRTDYPFPPPTGEYINFSNSQLRAEVRSFTNEIRDFEKKHDIADAMSKGPFESMPDRWNAISDEYRSKLAPKALSLASELIARMGSLKVPPMQSRRDLDQKHQPWRIRQGLVVVQRQMLIGPVPISSAADFLEVLTEKLPQ